MELLCWIWTWSILNSCVWAAAPHYSVHEQLTSFDDAAKACSPGTLTTLAIEEELHAVLSLISQNQDQNQFIFWVGLRKVRGECVFPLAPLRGFHWIQDGSEESEVSRWAIEPEPTCLSDRCVALRGSLNGSLVADWGMIPVKCKSKYQYICKTIGKLTTPTTATPKSGTESPRQELPTTKPARPGQDRTRQGTQQPAATREPPGSQTYGPEIQPEPGPESQTLLPIYPHTTLTDLVNEAGSGQGSRHGPDTVDSHVCKKPHVPSARFLSLDPKHPLNMLVECWPGQQVQVWCSGQPPSWHLLNGSPANFSSVCRRCGRGFQPDGEGNCVDVDECDGSGGGGALCSHSCVNTLGSYLCTCLDQSGQPQEDPALCSGSGAPGFRCPLLLLLLLLRLLL